LAIGKDFRNFKFLLNLDLSWCLNGIGEYLNLVFNIVMWIAKSLVIFVIYWNDENVESWLNRWILGVLNDVAMLKLDWYDNDSMFIFYVDSCRINYLVWVMFINCGKVKV
jgi:hypothetical protein